MRSKLYLLVNALCFIAAVLCVSTFLVSMNTSCTKADNQNTSPNYVIGQANDRFFIINCKTGNVYRYYRNMKIKPGTLNEYELEDEGIVKLGNASY